MRRWAKFGNTPRRRTRTSRSRGPNSRAFSGISASGATPLSRRMCAGRKACSTASGAGGRGSGGNDAAEQAAKA